MEQKKIIDKKYILEQLSLIENERILDNHPLFSKLNLYSPKQFADIMAPFYFAVQHWLHHLKLFHAKLIDNNDKASANLLQENINDELGCENGMIIYDKVHTTTFINFLLALGLKNKLKITSTIEIFNNQLDQSLKNNSLGYHAALLGGIEHFYIQICTLIKNYCDKNHIKQKHYNVHEIMDKKHAMDFFTISNNQNISNDNLLVGLCTGYELLWNVFQHLDV